MNGQQRDTGPGRGETAPAPVPPGTPSGPGIVTAAEAGSPPADGAEPAPPAGAGPVAVPVAEPAHAVTGALIALETGRTGSTAPLVVDLDGATSLSAQEVARAAEQLRIAAADRVVIGLAGERVPPPGPLLDAATLTLAGPANPAAPDRRIVTTDNPEADVRAIGEALHRNPHAGTVLAQVLRITAAVPVTEGLHTESLAYSMLMSGPEFADWLRVRGEMRAPERAAAPVLAERDGGTLRLVLNEPRRRNAYSAAMRDALVEALSVAVIDEEVHSITIRGEGPAFCSGGDLTEFGTGPGGPAAHAIRTQRSVGALLHRLRGRVHAQLHGACIGAGIELPAFAGRISAAPDTRIRLPEVPMGLIPGAGGTVSITRRAGRWRTAYLALTGHELDARTALVWGLVDDIRTD